MVSAAAATVAVDVASAPAAVTTNPNRNRQMEAGVRVAGSRIGVWRRPLGVATTEVT